MFNTVSRTLLVAGIVCFSAAASNAQQTNSQSAGTQQSKVKWLRSAAEAARAAEQTGKPILVYVRSATCHYCDLMKRNVWDDPKIAQQLMKDFIPLKLTREQNAAAIASLGVKGYPSTFVFNARRKFIGRIDGYVEPRNFVDAMQTARTAQGPTRLVR